MPRKKPTRMSDSSDNIFPPRKSTVRALRQSHSHLQKTRTEQSTQRNCEAQRSHRSGAGQGKPSPNQGTVAVQLRHESAGVNNQQSGCDQNRCQPGAENHNEEQAEPHAMQSDRAKKNHQSRRARNHSAGDAESEKLAKRHSLYRRGACAAVSFRNRRFIGQRFAEASVTISAVGVRKQLARLEPEIALEKEVEP